MSGLVLATDRSVAYVILAIGISFSVSTGRLCAQRPVGPNPLVRDPDLKFDKERHRLHGIGTGGVRAIAISKDSTLLAASHGRREIVIWDLALGKHKMVLDKHVNDVSQLAFDGTGKVLIAVCNRPRIESPIPEAVVTRWNLETGLVVESFSIAGNCYYGAISPDGRLLVTENDTAVAALWNLETRKELSRLDIGEPRVRKAAFAAHQKLLAISGYSKIKVWDVSSSKWKHELELDKACGAVEELFISPDARFLACRGESKRNEYHFWDLGSGDRLGPPLKVYGFQGQFTPDGTSFAVTMSVNSIDAQHSWVDFLSVEKQTFQARLMLPYLDGDRLVFSPNGKLVARSGPDGVVQILDVPNLGKMKEKKSP